MRNENAKVYALTKNDSFGRQFADRRQASIDGRFAAGVVTENSIRVENGGVPSIHEILLLPR
jgi:hypothetical protein